MWDTWLSLWDSEDSLDGPKLFSITWPQPPSLLIMLSKDGRTGFVVYKN